MGHAHQRLGYNLEIASLRHFSALWYNSIMRLSLNGEQKDFPDGMTLQQLLDQLAIPAGRVACEVNLQIIRRAFYAGTPLHEGDTIEIIQAIGGG